MALDFVIFRRENGSLVAVQVKSNTLLNQKDVEEQTKKLHEAAETVRQRERGVFGGAWLQFSQRLHRRPIFVEARRLGGPHPTLPAPSLRSCCWSTRP